MLCRQFRSPIFVRLRGCRSSAAGASPDEIDASTGETDRCIPSSRRSTMDYHIAPLFCRPWTLNGMSPRLIESHYEHNYGAALNRLNSVTNELEALDVKTTTAPVISRLSREQT